MEYVLSVCSFPPGKPMKINDWLKSVTSLLASAGISSARLDALILLEDHLKQDRSQLLAHPEIVLISRSLEILNKLIERRSKHEPLAYIRGFSEFYGRKFQVTPDTLEPRSETETIITLLKTLPTPKQDGPVYVDVGTGSGCLAITAKLEFPKAQVIATDISAACLKIAKHNAKGLHAKVDFFEGNLLDPLPTSSYPLPGTIILANLPYVPDSHTINQAAMFEPRQAIFGGEDGLDLYRTLFAQLVKKPAAYVITESLPFQHTELVQIAERHGYILKMSEDFIQVFQQI